MESIGSRRGDREKRSQRSRVSEALRWNILLLFEGNSSFTYTCESFVCWSFILRFSKDPRIISPFFERRDREISKWNRKSRVSSSSRWKTKLVAVALFQLSAIPNVFEPYIYILSPPLVISCSNVTRWNRTCTNYAARGTKRERRNSKRWEKL